MQYRKSLLFLVTSGLLLLMAGAGLWLSTPGRAEAQCGSQASSCKNCHEVQGQFSVNNDDTGWHEGHAFGDFCTVCHAGNQQATDITAAHEGMVPPLDDVEASCQQCHTNDLNERAEIYATILGVSLTGAGAGGSEPAEPPASANVAPDDVAEESATVDPVVAAAPVAAPSDAGETCVTTLVVDDPNAVDYVQRYNQIVLGEQPVNWGNLILGGMIGLLAVGGGGFVVMHELRLSAATKQVEGEYPADIVDMLPELAALKPQTRQSLKKVLANPRGVDNVLNLVDAVVSNDPPEE